MLFCSLQALKTFKNNAKTLQRREKMSLFDFLKKKKLPDPPDIHPKSHRPQPAPPPIIAQEQLLGGAQPQPPAKPAKAVLTDQEIKELEAAKFKQLGVDYQKIQELDQAGLAKTLRLCKTIGRALVNKIDPDELERQTADYNDLLAKGFINLKATPTQVLDALLELFKYDQERRKIFQCEKRLLPDSSVIEVLVLWEAQKRQRAKQGDLSKLPPQERERVFKAGTQAIFTEIMATARAAQQRAQAEIRLRKTGVIKGGQSPTEEQVTKMITQIKESRTPIPMIKTSAPASDAEAKTDAKAKKSDEGQNRSRP